VVVTGQEEEPEEEKDLASSRSLRSINCIDGA